MTETTERGPVWADGLHGEGHREVDATMALVDLVGFTALTERLAARGRAGAEEITNATENVFIPLLDEAYGLDGTLLKFGGDALLLGFQGDGHLVRAAAAASAMRRQLRVVGLVRTSVGAIRLQMTAGLHTGRFHLFHLGHAHHEPIVSGPGASELVRTEEVASASEIVISRAAAGGLPRPSVVTRDPGRTLLGRPPSHPSRRTRTLPTPPPQRQEENGREQRRSEHRLCTISFVRFRGVDRIVRREGIASAHTAIHHLVGVVARVCETHGVTFLGSDIDEDGGKLILVTGAPQATENDEERMLLAVRSILDEELPLSVSVGVNRGPVFAGPLGPSYRRIDTVMGDAVNVAARLAASARGGRALVTHPVLAASNTRFRVTRRAPLAAKGKAQPITAWSLGRRAGRRDPTDEGDFVGRAAELAALRRLVGNLDEQGSAVWIVGPAGIGKSRLAREATDGSPWPVLVVRGLSSPGDGPYDAVRPALRAIVDATAGEEIRTSSALTAHLRRVAPDLIPQRHALASALGLRTRPTSTEPASHAAATAQSIAAYLLATTVEPVVIVADDADRSGPAMTQVLTTLTLVARRTKMLLLITAREDPPASFTVPVIRLAGLADGPARALLASRSLPLLPADEAALLARADGNPLFLRELARRHEPGEDLPSTLESLLTARLDELPVDDREALRHLAVLGPRFERRLLRAVAAFIPGLDEPDLWMRLSRFIERGSRTIVFRDPTIQQVAYEGLPFGRRREVHAAIAVWLERLRPTTFADLALLASHADRAGDDGRTWRYARAAASAALGTPVPSRERADLLRRALRAGARLGTVDRAEEVRTWIRLCSYLHSHAPPEETLAHIARARSVAGADRLASGELLRIKARVLQFQGKNARAMRTYRAALTHVGTVDDPAAALLRFRSRSGVAYLLHQLGRDADARLEASSALAGFDAHPETALDTVSRLTWETARANLLSTLHLIAVGDRDPGSLTAGRAALEAARRAGDNIVEANTLNTMGMDEHYRGNWAAALRWYRRAASAYARAGVPSGQAITTVNVAEIHLARGHTDEAEASLEQAQRISEALGERSARFYIELHRATIAARRGVDTDVNTHLAMAGAIVEASRSISHRALLDGSRTSTALLLGDVPSPLPQAPVAIEAMRLLLNGMVAHHSGDHELAERTFRTSLQHARDHGSKFDQAIALEAIALVIDEPERSMAAARAARIYRRLDVVASDIPAMAAPRRPQARARNRIGTRLGERKA